MLLALGPEGPYCRRLQEGAGQALKMSCISLDGLRTLSDAANNHGQKNDSDERVEMTREGK